MGDFSISQLSAYTIPHQDDYADLPMAALVEATIRPATGNMMEFPTIEVQRQVAKIAYRIAVAPTVSDIRLQSVQAFNVPCRTTLFGEPRSSNTNADYTSCDQTNVPFSSESLFSSEYYQFANLQGTVTEIEMQKDKDAAHAPQFASYLLIRALRGEKVLAYRVYLGENNTDNFDVERNTSHQLDITIRGDDEIDTRITSYIVRVWDDIEEECFGGYCVQDSQRTLTIEVETQNNDLPLYAKVEVTKGDGGSLGLDHKIVYSYYEFELYNPTGTNHYEIDYCPRIYDETNSVLAYTVTVYDDGGFSQSFDFEHRFGNVLYGYIHDRLVSNQNRGTIAVQGTLYNQILLGSPHDLFMVVDQTGCTLQAIPSPGYRFDGWYEDASHTRFVAYKTKIAYKPRSFVNGIFARFVPDGIALNDCTANRDITPTLGVD